MNDITNFMTWWIEQVVNIFTKTYNILDSITFMGTSLLKVIITISLLSIIIPILLTIPINREIQVKEKTEKKTKKETLIEKAERYGAEYD